MLTIVGDVDPDDAFARAATYFGPLTAGEKPAKPVGDPLGPLAGTDRDETVGGGPGRGGLPVLAAAGPRHPASSTPSTWRSACWATARPRGCTSSWSGAPSTPRAAGATTIGLIGGNSFGFAYARARDGISPEQLEAELTAEVDRLGAEGPTEQELRRAKAQYERHWLHELARVDSRADALG